MIVLGDATYARGEVLGALDAGSKWIKFTDDEDLGREFSPQQLLSSLQAASQETRREGEEDVRGVATVRYVLEVDCDQAEVFDCAGTTAPVDVWIGDDSLVRRIRIEEGSSPATIEFYDFGVEVAIQPPPAEETQDVDDLFGGQKCAGDFGEPIGLGQALSAVRRQGFGVATDGKCSGGVAAFANANRTGSQTIGPEGHVFCLVRESPPADAPTSVRRSGADGADAGLELQNLECTIFLDRPNGDEQIDKLEAAFAELERTVRP